MLLRRLKGIGSRPHKSDVLPDDSLHRLTMGFLSYGSPKVRAYEGDVESVEVCAYTSIADEVVLLVGGNHRTDWISTFPFRARLGLPGAFTDGHPATRGRIVVGSDVWIGRSAVILSGVHIGHGAVVGASAVVTKDVRPYAIVVGNPAREVRWRFSDHEVEALLRISWWDWPVETVLERVPELSSGALSEFIERYDVRRSIT